ncbi:MAG: hypothetical protein LBG21_02955 [Campylobacteraceae bacterium]|jgi:hypothetical protein|nr:hypothetical protein [Campylobacteraceae bacterium]
MRFLRSYEIIVRTSKTEAFRIKQGNVNGVFKEGLRVSFNSTKSIYDGLNQCTLHIFNLEPKKRESIVKFEEETKECFQVQVKAGYVDNINLLFTGNILTAFTTKESVDYTTEIDCAEGLFDFQNCYISQTVKGDDFELLKECEKTLKEAKLAGYTKVGNESVRGRTLEGRTYDIMAKLAKEKNKLFYVDNNKIFLLDENEVTSTNAVYISSDELVNTPTRKNYVVNVTILMNPAIELGGLIKLESTFKQLNGFYRVEKINTSFDSHNGTCVQSLELKLMNNYRKVDGTR